MGIGLCYKRLVIINGDFNFIYRGLFEFSKIKFHLGLTSTRSCRILPFICRFHALILLFRLINLYGTFI